MGLILLPLAWLEAQEPIFEVFRKTDGLRDQNLFHSYQDSKLRMWVASDLGISLLDGQQIRVPSSENEMPEIAILKIREDINGNLWFLTMSGNPVMFDGNLYHSQWGEEFVKGIRGANYLSAFAPVNDGSVLFGTNDGRAFQIFADGSHRFFFKENRGGIHLIEVLGPQHFVFHFSKVNGFADWDHGRLTFTTFKPLLDSWVYGTLRTTKLANGKYIFGVENRVAVVERSGDTLIKRFQFSIPEKNLIYVGEDAANNIWFGTNEGAIKFLPTDSLFKNPVRYLKGRFVTSVSRDHENGLWFTTDEGLFHCKNENVLCSKNESNETNDEATAIFLDRGGSIFLGFKSGKIQEISRNDYRIIKEHPNSSEKSNPKIIRFQEGPDGSLLAASFGGLLKIKNGIKTIIANNKFSDFSVFGDKACACLFNGWSVIDLAGDWEKRVPEQLIGAHKLQSNRCLHCRFDHSGNLWVSTYSEVLRVSSKGIDTVFNYAENSQAYTNSTIQVTEDTRIAFGTYNRGIYYVSKQGLSQISKNHGLMDNHVFDYTGDSDQAGWVLTAQGLSKVAFNEQTPEVLFSLSKLNLFADKEVRGFVTVNDTMWAAAGNGFVMLPLAQVNKVQDPPQVRITRLWVNNASIDITQPIILDYQENNLRIEYNAITFSDPNLVEYR